jgi:hypothetical protein
VRFGFSILISLFLVTAAYGQTDTIKQKNDTLPGRVYLLQKVNRNGETLPEIEIKEVMVLGHQKGVAGRRTLSEYRKYTRLVYNLKRAYPYAMIVRLRLEKVNQDLSKITDEKERRKYIKDFEKEIFGEYEDDIRDMTITQGRLLIKLIVRETLNT